MQAAIGCAQLDKLPGLIEARRRNWATMHRGLSRHAAHLILPEATAQSEPSWFGFVITVREGAPFSRNDLTGYLESHRVETRNLFGGNLLRHPSFEHIAYMLETFDAFFSSYLRRAMALTRNIRMIVAPSGYNENTQMLAPPPRLFASGSARLKEVPWYWLSMAPT